MNDPFRNYDAWKTASPYDDVDECCDICDHDAAECICLACPVCGEQGNRSCYVDAEAGTFGACRDPGELPCELDELPCELDDLPDILSELGPGDGRADPAA